MKKIGRNDPCDCGSGRKYKKCCNGNKIRRFSDLPSSVQEVLSKKLEIHKANEVIRQKQQGLGKPLIQAKVGDQQIVAVGNKVHFSKKWKVPVDFYSDYIKDILGTEWGNVELAKPFEQRHLIIQWYCKFCEYQKNFFKEGEINMAPLNGAAICYLGLAYNLYLLKHNVELQELMIKRLKNIDDFQGAFYELIVANCLIRAGFDLTLIDETDRSSGHCEFDAVCRESGEKYTIEAKTKAVEGFFGKHSNNSSRNADPTSKLIKHLNQSLKKPANGKRLIFIDLNADPEIEKKRQNEPSSWVEKAAQKLEKREKDLIDQHSAYVFITNIPYHRDLDSIEGGMMIFAHGFRIDDFAKPGVCTLSQNYKNKQKHIDAYRILESFQKYPNIPQTFDGSIPCYAFNKKLERIVIGEKYFFEDVDGGVNGTVTFVTVSKTEKIIYLSICTDENKNLLLKRGISDDELRDYEEYGDSFFGSSQQTSTKKIDDPYELFECFHDVYKKSSKEKLLEFLQTHPSIGDFQKMDQEDLAILYCELIADAVRKNKVD